MIHKNEAVEKTIKLLKQVLRRVPKFRVEMGDDDDYIRILRNGKEVLYWENTEWEEDPFVVYAMVNAICTALTDPSEMDKRLRLKALIPVVQRPPHPARRKK